MAKKQNPSGNDRQLHDWAMNILEDAVERRRSFEGEWWNNIAAYAGDLWSEFDPWTKKLTSTKPKPWKSRMPINLIQPVVRTEYAKILKNKPITDVLAKSNDRTHLNSAEVGDDMLNQYAEEHCKIARVRRRMAWWTLITGFGFVFTDHNEKAMGEQEVLIGPDGQPIVDQRIIQAVQRHYREKHKKPKTKRIPQGDLEIVAGGPFNLVWDMSKIFFEDAWWCIYTEVYDVDEVYNRWGVEIKGSDDALPGVIERRMLEGADLTGRIKMRKVT